MLWIGPVRLLWALHVQCTVNSVCHLGPQDGKDGSSRNVAWLVFAHLGQGENWHGNHHQRPAGDRIGIGWQLDLGWQTIRALRLLGLASAPVRASQTVAVPESATV
jgi:stearoyl-CoA desaturase (delta-9 desaturase)